MFDIDSLRRSILHPNISSKMTTRNISISVIVGSFFALLLYNIGFRTSKQPPIDHLQVDISKIASQAKSLAKSSWEYGTAAEALLELHNPELSVFGNDPLPADKIPYAPFHQVQSLEFVKLHIRTGNKTLIHSSTSAADPASLGVSAVLLGQTDVDYLKAAHNQIDYLLKEAPRLENGAISHRKDTKEAWADFMLVSSSPHKCRMPC
jgi:hypothetical protein